MKQERTKKKLKPRIFKAAVLLVMAVFFITNLSLTPVQAGVFGNQLQDNTIWYVSPSGNNADGTSWAAAFTDLQSALDAASSGDQIWVAAGVYTPGPERTDSFNLVPGTALYGGFAGTETTLAQRDWANHPTILSGDIGGDDLNADGNFISETSEDIIGENSFHVIFADGTTSTPITASTVLDGFTITAGQANDDNPYNQDVRGGAMYCAGYSTGSECSPSLLNLTFSGNTASQGGAIYNNGYDSGSSSPYLENVIFTGNHAANGGALYNHGESGISSPELVNITFMGNSSQFSGGAIYNNGLTGVSNPSLMNVLFSENTSAQSGGAMYSFGFSGISSPNLVNITFFGNTATSYGGAMYNYGYLGTSSPNLVNVILWENAANLGSQLFNTNATSTLTTSLIEGGLDGDGIRNEGNSSVIDGGGNLEDDPRFVDTDNGDLHFLPSSPAIDSGTNSAVSVSTDLDGNPRITDGNADGNAVVDIGAYEYQQISTRTIYLPLVIR